MMIVKALIVHPVTLHVHPGGGVVLFLFSPKIIMHNKTLF